MIAFAGFPRPLVFGLLAGAASMLALPAFAQRLEQSPMGHRGMTSEEAAPKGLAAAPSSLMESMDKMDRDMAAAPMTGNVDRDFVAMMIPHHQGAVDMARIELANGKDPAMRELAGNIIDAQQREIALMTRWLAEHPAKP